MTSSPHAIAGKQLALLKELVPSIARIDALVAKDDLPAARVIPDAARNLNLKLRTFPIARGEEIAPIIAASEGQADALFVGDGPIFNTFRGKIATLVAQIHLPVIYTACEGVLAGGGVISYGASIRGRYAKMADYVSKLLSGAKPSDLPVEMPTMFELVLNLRTAKALGITVPPTLLARADEVIE
jgi:putative ABC transport system substrate-binding protein